MGCSSERLMKEMVCNGWIQNCNIFTDNVANTEYVFGSDFPTLKGKYVVIIQCNLVDKAIVVVVLMII